MPRHVLRAAEKPPQHLKLVKRLAQEIKTPGSNPLPLILEEEIKSTSSRHVQVIWDQWRKLPDEERWDVIIEAYRRAEGEAYAGEITIASGHTSAEALALGLLPWIVEAKALGPTEYERAVHAEAAHTVLGLKQALKYGLRYAREEDAEAARDRLRSVLPLSRWIIRRDLSQDDD